jgi:hypothetical protein
MNFLSSDGAANLWKICDESWNATKLPTGVNRIGSARRRAAC